MDEVAARRTQELSPSLPSVGEEEGNRVMGRGEELVMTRSVAYETLKHFYL